MPIYIDVWGPENQYVHTGTYSLIWRMLIVKRRACFVRRSGFRWGDHNPAADFVLSISVVAWMVVLEVMMASLWMVIRISVLQCLPELAVHKIVEEELLLYFFVWTKVSRLWLTFAKAQQSYTSRRGGDKTQLWRYLESWWNITGPRINIYTQPSSQKDSWPSYNAKIPNWFSVFEDEFCCYNAMMIPTLASAWRKEFHLSSQPLWSRALAFVSLSSLTAHASLQGDSKSCLLKEIGHIYSFTLRKSVKIGQNRWVKT